MTMTGNRDSVGLLVFSDGAEPIYITGTIQWWTSMGLSRVSCAMCKLHGMNEPRLGVASG